MKGISEALPATPESIKESVREYYADRIETVAGADCCGPEEGCGCCADSLYSAAELASLPTDVTNASFGCGNPTALAELKPGEVVLDLGSGSGLDVLLAAQRVGPQGFVYGVDMTDRMLEKARANAARAGVANVAFLKGDIEAIPLPDASVDVIISNCVINLAPDKELVLQEAFRVLRPGGRLAVSDIVIDGDLSDLPVSPDTVRTALSWAGCIAGALTMDQYRTWLAAAGFESVGIEVRSRYSLEEFRPFVEQDESAQRALHALEADALANGNSNVLADLARRFTSSAVTAVRPGGYR